jgi:hypothetical protein
MGLMGIVVFASCDKGSEYDSDMMKFSVKPEPTPNPNPTPTPTPTDTTSTPIWDVPSKISLKPIGEPSTNSHKWEGTMVFYCGKDSLVKKADQTVEFSMAPATGFSSAKTTEPAKYVGPSSISLNSTNTTYGEYYTDAEGNKLRQVTLTAELKTSEFNKTLTMSRREAWAQVNGREHAFLSHNMSASFKSLDVVETKEVERNDSIFEQKTYRLVFITKFAVSAMNVRTYEVFATHTVEAFVKMVEKEEKMPAADLYVGKLIKATDVVASPVWAGNEKIGAWAKTSLVEDETSYHIWVDGKFVRTVAKSTLSGSNYNAAMMDGDVWVPCLCQKKNGALIYAVEYADGSYKIHTVDENLALSSGLKNFTKNDVAAQTPFVKTTREQKTYNGKAWMKLTCYNVDGKPTLSYTVAER